MRDPQPSWSDQLHQLALSLEPPQHRRDAWGELPPAATDAHLLLSLLLDAPLTKPRPSAWPTLIQHLLALASDRWELLIPGPAPAELEELRRWLPGSLRCFPELDAGALQSQAPILGSGCWLLPVSPNTALSPALAERVEAYDCWSADTLLLGPDPVELRRRQSLWTQSNGPCLWISAPLVQNPGRSFLTPSSPANTEAPLQVVVDAEKQPQRLLLSPELATQVGAEHCRDPLTLLARAEAIGIPPLVHSGPRHTLETYLVMPLTTASSPGSWPLHAQLERRAHALLVPLTENQTIPVQAQHWQLAGFTVVQSANPEQLQQWPELRWLTWLSSDSLIAATDLDQLRVPGRVTRPLLRDRGSGQELTKLPTPHQPVGLTVPLQAHGSSTIALGPPSDWLLLAAVTLALDRPPIPRKPTGQTHQAAGQAIMQILHRFRSLT